ncbi:hypothetical protein LTR35_011390 [Friedmanniomyces endolithicus]|nr:hypothetical protein LTR35_011390 [Friedmanniomyces endolithicus]KAK0291613.1 hypothetical protein LTS00_008305 [Friedmanniomyces endolithicus]KAK0995059.1 hypothetical protein LTR54_010566 [Friedmanniomyces endolithicus]
MRSCKDLEDGPPPPYNPLLPHKTTNRDDMDQPEMIPLPVVLPQPEHLPPPQFVLPPNLSPEDVYFLNEYFKHNSSLKKKLRVDAQAKNHYSLSYGPAVAVWLGTIIFAIIVLVWNHHHEDAKFDKDATDVAIALVPCFVMLLANTICGRAFDWMASESLPSFWKTQFCIILRLSFLSILSLGMSIVVALLLSTIFNGSGTLPASRLANRIMLRGELPEEVARAMRGERRAWMRAGGKKAQRSAVEAACEIFRAVLAAVEGERVVGRDGGKGWWDCCDIKLLEAWWHKIGLHHA